MKVGDLVRYENAAGKYEIGIVTEMDVPNKWKTLRVMVYFFDDAAESLMTKALLEVVTNVLFF